MRLRRLEKERIIQTEDVFGNEINYKHGPRLDCVTERERQ